MFLSCHELNVSVMCISIATILCIRCCMVCLCPGASSGAAELLCEGSLGLPHDGHNWFQLAPTAPVQGMVGPSSKNGNALWKMFLRKGRTSLGAKHVDYIWLALMSNLIFKLVRFVTLLEKYLFFCYSPLRSSFSALYSYKVLWLSSTQLAAEPAFIWLNLAIVLLLAADKLKLHPFDLSAI